MIYAGVWLAGYLWKEYNGLKGLHEKVRQAESQVKVQLQRRSDLIPALASVIRGLMNHEQSAQNRVGEMRAGAVQNPVQTEKALIAIVENYPELQSSDSVMNLQKSMIDTEDRIQLARSYYNDVATFYNTRLRRIPDNLIAWMARLRPKPLIHD